MGGTFTAINGTARTALARLNPITGAVDTGFDPRLSAPGLARTRVEHFDISPDGTRLIAVGALLKAGAAERVQIAMFDVSGAAARLDRTGTPTRTSRPAWRASTPTCGR